MTETEIAEWAKKLTKRFDNVKIVGSQGEWSGDARQGFMFNPKPIITSTPVPPPEITGACCFDDGTCSVLTAALCDSSGGDYQGDGTDCSPNPCPPPPPDTGACCFEDGTCSIETAENCELDGGTYKGDGTVCFPNPCDCLPPECVFVDPLGDGRSFRTAFYTQDVRIYGSGGVLGACCRETGSTGTYIGDPCVFNCVGNTEFSFAMGGACSSYFNHGAGCHNTCIGVYAGCSYSPGVSIMGNTWTLTYCCGDGCTEGVDCLECGTVSVTYSDEVTPCP